MWFQVEDCQICINISFIKQYIALRDKLLPWCCFSPNLFNTRLNRLVDGFNIKLNMEEITTEIFKSVTAVYTFQAHIPYHLRTKTAK